MSQFDNTALYGSNRRLTGFNVFPIPGFFDGAEPTYQHELGHQWINFLPVAPLDQSIPHRPLSDLASDIMGWSTRNGQGLQFNFDLVPDGSDFKLVTNNNPKVFSDLSLYLMGFLPSSQVGRHFVFANQNQSTAAGKLSGPVVWFGIEDIVRVVGPRVPDHMQSPKEFKIATIFVSRDSLLSADAMALYDFFAARAEETKVVPYSSGFAKGRTNPFFLSTRGLGKLITRIRVIGE